MSYVNQVEVLENVSELTAQIEKGHAVYTKEEVAELLKALYVTIEESEQRKEVDEDEVRQKCWEDAKEAAANAFEELDLSEYVDLDFDNYSLKMQVGIREKEVSKEWGRLVEAYFNDADC